MGDYYTEACALMASILDCEPTDPVVTGGNYNTAGTAKALTKAHAAGEAKAYAKVRAMVEAAEALVAFCESPYVGHRQEPPVIALRNLLPKADSDKG